MGTSREVESTISDVQPYVVYGRLVAFGFSLSLWLYLWATKTDIGKDVFGYKGDNKWLQLRRELAIYAWWCQSSLVFLSLTILNNLFLDSLTIFFTLTFGASFYNEFPKIRALFGLEHSAHWIQSGCDYLCNILFNLSHHISVSYVILFESDTNKVLYRFLFVWLWSAHVLRQIMVKHRAVITRYVTSDWVWTLYWKIGPYLIGYWYVTDFMHSDNKHLSPGLLMLFVGRWGLSFNWPATATWPLEKRWKGETINSMVHISMAYLYCHSMAASWPLAVAYAVVVCFLQQVEDAKAEGTAKYSWEE